MSASSKVLDAAIGSNIESPSSPRPHKPLSCVSCARRKVKCDRQVPCVNCIKSGIDCIAGSRSNYRPRQKAVHVEHGTLVRLLKHYEKLLLGYGAKKDELDGFDQGRLEDSSMTPCYASDTTRSTEGSSSHFGRVKTEKYVI
jgi:hypothetical protein